MQHGQSYLHGSMSQTLTGGKARHAHHALGSHRGGICKVIDAPQQDKGKAEPSGPAIGELTQGKSERAKDARTMRPVHPITDPKIHRNGIWGACATRREGIVPLHVSTDLADLLAVAGHASWIMLARTAFNLPTIPAPLSSSFSRATLIRLTQLPSFPRSTKYPGRRAQRKSVTGARRPDQRSTRARSQRCLAMTSSPEAGTLVSAAWLKER